MEQSLEGKSKYKNTIQATKLIFHEEGVRGFFKGYWAALLTYAPFVGIYFVSYEHCKKLYKRLWLKKDPKITSDSVIPFYYSLTSGFISGAFGAFLTCPMDVVKTRLQVESSNVQDGYKGILDCLVRIFREEGMTAFWKGVGARVMWVAPGTAITIACYDWLKTVWFMRL